MVSDRSRRGGEDARGLSLSLSLVLSGLLGAAGVLSVAHRPGDTERTGEMTGDVSMTPVGGVGKAGLGNLGVRVVSAGSEVSPSFLWKISSS